MAPVWLAAFLLAIVAPPVILVIAGFAASRLAGRAAARQQEPEYSTEQTLALTYLEAPEQWPPAPLIEVPPACPLLLAAAGRRIRWAPGRSAA